jgi:hypothetical protein
MHPAAPFRIFFSGNRWESDMSKEICELVRLRRFERRARELYLRLKEQRAFPELVKYAEGVWIEAQANEAQHLKNENPV